jgi:hypothetical protein
MKINRWAPRIISLDEDGLIHIHSEGLKAFSDNKDAPLETMNLSTAISVRLTDVAYGKRTWSNFISPLVPVLQINTTKRYFFDHNQKRVVFIQANSPMEAATWVLEIKKIIMMRSLQPSSEIIMLDVAESVILKVRPTNPENTNNSTITALLTAPKVVILIILLRCG